MKKNVIAAIGFCGLVLSQPATGMLDLEAVLRRSSVNEMRHMLATILDGRAPVFTPPADTPKRTNVERLTLLRASAGLRSVRVMRALAFPKTARTPVFMFPIEAPPTLVGVYPPIVVPNTPVFEIANGFCGLQRYVVLRLLSLIRDRSDTVRTVLGTCREIERYRLHTYFVTARVASHTGPIPRYLTAENAISYVLGRLHCGYNVDTLEAHEHDRKLSHTGPWALYRVLLSIDKKRDPLDWAVVSRCCARPDIVVDLAAGNVRVADIPDDLVDASLWHLAECDKVYELSLHQANQISCAGIIAADHPRLAGQLVLLARRLGIPVKPLWKTGVYWSNRLNGRPHH